MPQTTSSTVSNLPEWLNSGNAAVAAEAARLSEIPFRQYSGQRVAPINNTLAQAIRLSENTGLSAPIFRSSEESLNRSNRSYPENYQQYLNPYIQQSNRAIQDEATRAYREQILPDLERYFIGAGQRGSQAHQRMTERAIRDQQEAVSRAQQQNLLQGYREGGEQFNAEANRNQEAGRLYAGLGTAMRATQDADINALTQAGALQRDIDQINLDNQYNDFLREQQSPYERLSYRAGILHGTPFRANTYTTTNTPDIQRSRSGRGLNLLGAGLGVGRAFGLF